MHKNAPEGACMACLFRDASEAFFDATWFGKYKILETLGQGGMGTVLLVQQSDPIRRVALKQLSAGVWATQDQLERFRRETMFLSRLGHPNILPVLDVGKVRGVAYYTMPFMEAGSLAEPSLQKKLRGDPLKLVSLMATVARTIQHVHDRQLLHRDLKPANILIGDDLNPYVTDFGLAKDLSGGPAQTVTGGILGTPGYMAPEQVDSEFGDLTTLTDVHGLGAVFYELLTGSPPFGALEGDGQTLLQKVRTIQPAFQGHDQLAIDRELQIICLKCLEKQPRDRYQSALHFAEDLDRWLRHEPILAKQSGAIERLLKWKRRKPAIAGLSAALALSILVGFVLSLWLRSRAEEARDLAAERSRRMVLQQAESYFSRGNNAMGFALLARSIRDEPRFRAGEERLANQLTMVPHLIPAGMPPLESTSFSFAQPAFTPSDEPQKYLRQAKSPQGTWMAEVTNQVQILLIRPTFLSQNVVLDSPHTNLIRTLVAMGEQTFVSGDDSGRLCVWDVARNRIVSSGVVNIAIQCSAVSEDGDRIAVGGRNGDLEIYSTATFEPLSKTVLPNAGGAVNSVRFRPFTKDLLAAYDVGTEGEVALLSGSSFITRRLPKPVWDIQTLGASDRLYVLIQGEGWLELRLTGPSVSDWGSDQGVLRTKSAERRKPIATILGKPSSNFHSAPILFTNVSPDGRLLVTASRDRTARLWHTRTGLPAGPGWQHADIVNCARFSPDGLRVITSTSDRTLRLWDPASAQPLSPPIRYDSPIANVEFAPDGRRVVVDTGHSLSIHQGNGESPGWLAELAEFVGGVRLDEDGTVQTLGVDLLRRSGTLSRLKELDDREWGVLKKVILP